MRESKYQKQVIERLRAIFPDCVILKNDSSYLQGVPDLILLVGPYWAMLEVKLSEKSHEQPNQAYYVSMLAEMSFAAFIYPENEDEVMYELQHAFGYIR